MQKMVLQGIQQTIQNGLDSRGHSTGLRGRGTNSLIIVNERHVWPPSLNIRPIIPQFNVSGRTLDYLEAPFLNIFLHTVPSQLRLRNRSLLRILPCLKSDSNITPIILTYLLFTSYMILMIY